MHECLRKGRLDRRCSLEHKMCGAPHAPCSILGGISACRTGLLGAGRRLFPSFAQSHQRLLCFEPCLAPRPFCSVSSARRIEQSGASSWTMRYSLVQSSLDSMGILPVQDWIPLMEKTYLGEGLDQCAIVPYAIFKRVYFMEILKIKLLHHMYP